MTSHSVSARTDTGSISLQFPHSKEQLRKIEVSDNGSSYTIYRLMPFVKSWPAADVPDGPNPRSHQEECLRSGVAKAIRKTLIENPEDFSLANRGGCLLADSLKFDPERGRVTVVLTDLEIHGMADGATSNAVISEVQKLSKSSPNAKERDVIDLALEKARFNLEVVVGLTEHERIMSLVKGRNTSVQVRPWSLADFDRKFDWIKELIDRNGGPFAGRIGWEENSGADVSVLDLISLMTLFHPIFDDPAERRRRAPTSAFSGKGTNDKRLLDSKMESGYRKLGGVLEDLIRLHDHVYKNFEPMYERYNKEVHNKGSKLGKRRGIDNKPITLPLTGDVSEYKIDKGLIFPLLASFRCLLNFDQQEARWLMEPFEFFDQYGTELMGLLFEQYELCGRNPATTGKKKTVYTSLHNQARLLLSEKIVDEHAALA